MKSVLIKKIVERKMQAANHSNRLDWYCSSALCSWKG